MKAAPAFLILFSLIALGACSNDQPAEQAVTVVKRAPGVAVEPASLSNDRAASYSPASSADIRSGALKTLLTDLESACTTNDPTLFYSLFTERVRDDYSRLSREKIAARFAEVCQAQPAFLAQLSQGALITPNRVLVRDGQRVSSLCPMNPQGECQGGIAVGLENGKLKISDM